MMVSGSSFVIGLPRPQYPAVPEAFISALAWRLFEVSIDQTDGKAVGLRYRSSAGTERKTLAYRSTSPVGEKQLALGEALLAQGITGETTADTLGQAIANSVDGVKTLKGDSQAASPLTPALALLQNVRGVTGSRNPPDLGEIIEQLFHLGSSKSSSQHTASERWLAAAEHRMEGDRLLSAIDRAVDQTLLEDRRVKKTTSFAPRSPSTMPSSMNTPFEWFRNSWIAITSDEWVDALPARVWVDWATTVMRLGFGLGYLWESLWYETLARHLVDPESPVVTWHGVVDAMPDTIPWRSSQSSPQTRDVAPLLVSRSHRAVLLRATLSDWIKQHDASLLSFVETCELVRGDPAVMDDLQRSLRSTIRRKSGDNLWEASRYSLMTRASSGPHADYYGLLQKRGRYLTPDPGTEWIAVVASLACGGPRRVGTVAKVIEDLGSLGLKPELSEVVALLERAGLARGSADADQGVLVQSAF